MASQPIPYGTSLTSGIDELADGTAAPVAINLLVDQAGVIQQRPGIVAYQDTGTVGEILGLTVWGNYAVYVTADRSIWALSLVSPSMVTALSDTTSATKLAGSLRPIFAATHNTLIITGGGVPQKWTGAGLSSRLGGSPPAATHVTIIGQRVVVNINDNSGRFQFSDLGEGNIETWPAENVQEAESKPDSLLGLYENTRALWAFGAATTQIFGVSPDPLVPYSSTVTLNRGCGARYSPVQTHDGFAWLGDERDFLRSNGSEAEDISLPWISKTLHNMGTVEDAIGFRMMVNSLELFVWTFPSEGRAFCYEAGSKKWSEWAGFASGEFSDLPISGYAYDSARNLHLAGLTTGEGICELSMGTFSDLGEHLVGNIRTGFEDRGTDDLKHSKHVNYRFRRGLGEFNGTSSNIEIRHRDDLGTWGGWRFLDIGIAGDYRTQLTDYGVIGQYRSRQYELRYSGSDRLSIIEAKETFEVVENS